MCSMKLFILTSCNVNGYSSVYVYAGETMDEFEQEVCLHHLNNTIERTNSSYLSRGAKIFIDVDSVSNFDNVTFVNDIIDDYLEHLKVLEYRERNQLIVL